MKYLFLLIAFTIPSITFGAFNVIQSSSTHALGFDIEDIDLTGISSGEIRVYAPGSRGTTNRSTSCATYSFTTMNPSGDNNDIFVSIRPQNQMYIPFTTTANFTTAQVLNFYNCIARGTHYVALFNNITDTSPEASDTIYLEQEALDHRSVFVIIFLIGALLAVLRPVISKLTLR